VTSKESNHADTSTDRQNQTSACTDHPSSDLPGTDDTKSAGQPCSGSAQPQTAGLEDSSDKSAEIAGPSSDTPGSEASQDAQLAQQAEIQEQAGPPQSDITAPAERPSRDTTSVDCPCEQREVISIAEDVQQPQQRDEDTESDQSSQSATPAEVRSNFLYASYRFYFSVTVLSPFET